MCGWRLVGARRQRHDGTTYDVQPAVSRGGSERKHPGLLSRGAARIQRFPLLSSILLPALAGGRRWLSRGNGNGRRGGSRRHARGCGRARVLASGAGAVAPGEHKRQDDDDEHGASDPAPWAGGAHRALHLGLAFHVHASIEVSGVRHGDLHLTSCPETTRNRTAKFLSPEPVEGAQILRGESWRESGRAGGGRRSLLLVLAEDELGLG